MTPEAIRRFCKAAAIVCVAAGGYGMLLCVPFIIGRSVTIIAAASLPFIAGAVLIAGGLVSYSLLIRQDA